MPFWQIVKIAHGAQCSVSKREHEREKEKGPQIEVGQPKKEQKEEKRKKIKKSHPNLYIVSPH